MIDITAANTARLPTRAKPSDEPKRYRTRRDAEAAAVFTIGEHARREFEFTTAKVDGGWIWRRTDEVPPMTPAEIKANGGQRAVAAMALYIPPVMAPKAPVALPTFYDQMREAGQLRSAPVQAPTRIDPVATAAQADDPLAIPAFLKRESTPEEKEAVRKKLARTVGPGRVIKDPPDVKTKRAEQREARQAEFEETPASARRKAREKAETETRDNGAHPAKRASKPRAKAAGASGAFQTKAALIKAGISAGHDDDAIVKDVNRDFPGCNYQPKDIKFYRRKMESAA